jgi:hypothetical protein
MAVHRLFKWEAVAEARLAELKHAREELLELFVLSDGLWPPAFSNPTRREAVELVGVLLVQGRLALINLGSERLRDHLCTRLALAGHLDMEPFLKVFRFEMDDVPARTSATLGRRIAHAARLAAPMRHGA